jgi:hypothetical protein
VTPEEFVAAARIEFPELSSVLDDDPLFYLQVGSLASHTQAAIDDGDRAEVRKHFEFVRKADLAGDSDVQNALGVSYLEHLNFRMEIGIVHGHGISCRSHSGRPRTA